MKVPRRPSWIPAKTILGDKIHKLFVTILPGDRDPVGAVEFERNLARARVADIENLEKNPRADRLEVEDAMFVTLKKRYRVAG